MARTAYAASGSPVRTERGTEYQAFAGITARMKAASDKGQPGYPALAAALHDNRRLWAILASDVADKENGLAGELRARIFWLAEFTRQHTTGVLAGKADPAILIEINSAMMNGLRGEGAAG
jgi:flagellar protein FlaF